MTEMVQKEHGKAKAASGSAMMLVLSIVLLIVGIALIANPVAGLEVVMMILGIILIAYGVITILTNAMKGIRDARTFVIPAILIIVGILLIAFRGPVAGIVLPLILGIAAIVYGLVNLVKSNRVKHDGGYWQASFILALITLGLGIVMLAVMFAGGNAAGVTVGVILAIFAVVSIVQWFIERSAAKNAG